MNLKIISKEGNKAKTQEDSKIARFLADLNRLMIEHDILINGNAGINIKRMPEKFKGYMAEKWANGEGFDLRPINKKLIYPLDPSLEQP